MEPNEVFEGNLGELVARLESVGDDVVTTAVRTVIAVMLTYGIGKFDTRMIPDVTNSEVCLRLTNGHDSKSWCVEIVNCSELRGATQ